MRKKIILIILLFNFYSVRACQCTYIPIDFIEYINLYYSTQNSFSIVKGFKISDSLHNGKGCEYKVIQNLFGVQTQDTVTVWGDPGWNCWEKPSYNIGDTTITIIYDIKAIDPNAQYMQVGDYYCWSCGFPTLLVKNDSVFGGHVTSFTFNGFNYNSFLDSLNSTLNNLPTSTGNYSKKGMHLKIYPNPSNDIINLEGDFNLPIVVTVYNIFGQNIISKEIFKNNIDISQLKTGTYFLNVKGQREYSVKFVKSD